MSNSIIMGRVAKELEVVSVGEKNVAKFSIAVDTQRKDKEGNLLKDENGKPLATFYNVECWQDNYFDVLKKGLVKGLTVMLKGQLVIEPYTRADDSKDNDIKIINPEVHFLGAAKTSAENVFIAGRVTKDFELKTLESGKRVCNFTVAENYGKDKVNFFDIEAWDKAAEIYAANLGKGSTVKVTGNLRIEPYLRPNGSKGTSIKIVEPEIAFLNRVATVEKSEQAPKGKTKSALKTKGAEQK